MMIRVNKKRSDVYNDMSLLLFSAIWSSDTLIPICRELLNRIPLIGIWLSVVFEPLLWGILIALSLKQIAKKVRIIEIILYIVMVILVLIQIAFVSENSDILANNAVAIICRFMPIMFVGIALDFEAICKPGSDKNRFFLRLCYINLLFNIIYFYIYSTNMASHYTYLDAARNIRYTSFMSFAYATLPHLLFVIYDAFVRKSFVSICGSFLGFFVLLSQGTRGAVLCALLFIVVMIISSYKKSRRKIVLLIALLLLITTITINYTVVVETLGVQLQTMIYRMGFSTRVLDTFLSSSYIGDSGRIDMFSDELSLILAAPMFGYGLMGDTALLGSYSHNIILEMILEFGFIFGTIIILTICSMLFISYRETANLGNTKRAWLNIIVSISLVKLMFSGSYLTEQWFFFAIGVMIQIIRTSPKQQYDNIFTDQMR